MDSAALITAFVALFVIIDPIGLVPIFVALTQGRSASERRRIAQRACLIGAVLLTIFGLAGELVLDFMGISMDAFRIAGGILLFLTALDMLFERRSKRREDKVEDGADDPSVFPLATPLLAGPGAMATMILLTGQNSANALWMAAVFAVMGAVVILAYILFLAAGPTERVLGPTGTNVVTRLMGMLLAALSVQFVLDGFRSFGLVPH